jgi:Holliday junction resolvase RusA-like endonuclease
MPENNSVGDITSRSCKTLELKGTFFKENCLPDLNNLLAEATRHPMAYASMKRQMETVVINAVRLQLKGWQATNRVRLDITWGEKVKGSLRDYDNVVAAGRKIINDALVKAQVIKDDNPKCLGYGNNEFVYTDKPFIKVEIVEIEDFKK